MEIPADEDLQPTHEAALPHLVVDSKVEGPHGSFYLWNGQTRSYDEARAAYEDEAHLPKFPKYDVTLGNVASFVSYLRRFRREAEAEFPLITWKTTSGVLAVLDPAPWGPGTWTVRLPFTDDWRWAAWKGLCASPLKQDDAVDKLSKLVDTIVSPPSAELLSLLATLRSTVNATAVTKVNEDGTTDVSYQKENVSAAGSNLNLKVPSLVEVSTPVFRGFSTAYKLYVRVRVLPEERGTKLIFSMQNGEAIIEDVTNDIIGKLEEALAEGQDLPGWPVLLA